MGNVLEGCAKCTAVEVVRDEDEQTRAETPGGIRMIDPSGERAQKARETKLIRDINERTPICNDLENQIRRLREKARVMGKNLRVLPRGSDEFTRVANGARDALNTAALKTKELNYHRKFLGLTSQSLKKVSQVTSYARDREVMVTAHQYVTHIDIDQEDDNTMAIGDLATELADATHQLDTTARDTHATLDAIVLPDDPDNNLIEAGEKILSLASDDDLLTALDVLESGHDVGSTPMRHSMPNAPETELPEPAVPVLPPGLTARPRRTVDVEDMFSILL